jgi:hypothetical protein
MISAVPVRGPSRIYLYAAERSKGAAGVCCRQLDGRAAILMVVARPGGCELAGSVCGSFARWPFTCLEAVPPVVGPRRQEDVSKGRANLVALAACPCFHPAGNEDCRASRYALNAQLNPRVSRWGCVRRRDAVEDCIHPAHRVAVRCRRDIQDRRPRACTAAGRLDAPATGGAQVSRRCRRPWKGRRFRQIMITRSNQVSFGRLVSR